MQIFISGFADGSTHSSYLRLTDRIVLNNLDSLHVVLWCYPSPSNEAALGLTKFISGLKIQYWFENLAEWEALCDL